MTRTRRYFYAGGTNFEQSLDVYFPDSDAPKKLDLLVVLIFGAAWCGHLRIIYRGSDPVNANRSRPVARTRAAPHDTWNAGDTRRARRGPRNIQRAATRQFMSTVLYQDTQ